MLGVQQEFRPVRETQLAIDGRKMVGNRSVANVELARDFLVAHALAYPADDLIFPSGKR